MVIFLAAMVVRIVIAAVRSSHEDFARWEMELVAISLARNGFLGNPYCIPTGPSAHIMPGYAVILAAIFGLFGTATAAEFVKVLLSCFLTSAQYALLPTLGDRLSLHPAVGAIAGFTGALFPVKTYTEIQGDSEGPLAALLLLLLLCWSASLWGGRPGWLQASGYGALWGAGVLVTATFAPVAGVMVALLGAASVKRYGFRALSDWVVAVAAFGLTLSPWVIRNYLLFDEVVVTRTNFGLEFDISNHPESEPNIQDNDHLATHPFAVPAEAARIARHGEIAYNRTRFNRAVEWVKSKPAEFLTLVVQRVWYTWFPDVPMLQKLVMYPIAALGFFGLLILWKENRPAARILIVPVLVFPMPYYLVQVVARYRYPIDFIILLAAAAGVCSLWFGKVYISPYSFRNRWSSAFKSALTRPYAASPYTLRNS